MATDQPKPFIRTASEHDLEALLDLYQHLSPDDERATPENARDVFQRFSTNPHNAIFLCDWQGRLAATCTLVVIPNLTRCGRPYAVIENVVTHPDLRRHGLGQLVLAAATNAAWKAGCYKVMLMTGSQDESTLAFYRCAGFTQSKTGFQKRRLPPRA